MSEIKVNPGELRSVAGDIQRAINQMQSELDSVESGMKALVAEWEGDAQTEYYARQSEWNTASQDLKTLLESIRKSVLSSADIMEARENANRKRFGG